MNEENPKSKERLEILKKIDEYELEGKFDVDVEEDPPTIALTKDVDYLNKKVTSKINTSIANIAGKKFLKKIIKEKALIIKQISGIENLNNLESGAIITCNHFNPFDCFSIEYMFEKSNKSKSHKLYKVIREGNYTNFPGFYGFLFKNCNTLPLSSSTNIMEKFLEATSQILKDKNYILIYPEQSMWWNYKKPKPLKDGAFKMAVKNDVPVLPVFITMKESDIVGNDGFNIMEYYINIEKPIYKKDGISQKEAIKHMKKENYATWKSVYESFYEIPLTYTTKKEILDKYSSIIG